MRIADPSPGRETSRFRQVLAALATTILGVVLLSAWVSWASYREDRKLVIEGARDRAGAAATALDRYIQDQIAYLSALTKSPAIREGRVNVGLRLLRGAVPAQTSGLSAELHWFDEGGGVRASVPQSRAELAPRIRNGLFQRVRNNEAPAVSGVLDRGGSAEAVVALAAPILDPSGRFAGELAATISLERMSIVGHPARGAWPSLVAIDSTGRVVFDERGRIPSGRVAPGRLAQLRAPGVRTDATDHLDREERLIASVLAPFVGWTVLSNESETEAFGGAQDRLRQEWTAIGTVGLFGGLLAFASLWRLEGLRRRNAAQARAWQATAISLLGATDVPGIDGICVGRARELVQADSGVIVRSTPGLDSPYVVDGDDADQWESTIAERWPSILACASLEAASVLGTLSGSARPADAPFATVVACPLEAANMQPRALLLGFHRRHRMGGAELGVLGALSSQCSLTSRRIDALAGELATRSRLELINRVSEALAGALDPAAVVDVLLREGAAVVGAARGAVYRTASENSLELVGSFGYPHAFLDPWRTMQPDSAHPVVESAQTGRMVLLETPGDFESGYPSVAERRHPSSSTVAVVPLRAGDRTVGVLTLSFSSVPAVDPPDTDLLEAIADLGTLALDRAIAYESQRQIAARLQLALMPPMVPEVPGVSIAACYRPAASGVEVGGDWWDVVVLDDDRLVVVTGDVVGRGLEASAAMGQLRSASRAMALGFSLRPAEVLECLDRFVETFDAGRFTTIAYAVVDTRTGEVAYACAGHPPPLVVKLAGHVELLEEGRRPPLGLKPTGPRTDGHAILRVGEVLILYTDGLVERRQESLDVGLTRLAAEARRVTASGQPADRWPGLIADALSPDATGADDLCILTLERTAARAERFNRRFGCDPFVLSVLRRDLRVWLVALNVDSSEADDIILACSEAVSNAIEHAYHERGSAGFVQIDASYSVPDDLLIEIRDYGAWRDPPASGNRGRGKKIMASFADEFDTQATSTGTRVRMRFSHLGRRAQVG